MSTIPQPIFPEAVLTTPAIEYRNICIAELDRLFKYGQGVHKCPLTVSYRYEYHFKLGLCRVVLTLFADPTKQNNIIKLFDKRYPTEQLYFVIADWLNWDDKVCLYKRYELEQPTTTTTALVLQYPMPILAAACVVTELNYYWIANQIPEDKLNELSKEAERFTWLNLESKGFSKELCLAEINILKERFNQMARHNPEYD